MFSTFSLFGKEIGMYAVMVLCGVFTSGPHGCIMAAKRKYDYTDLIIFALIMSAGLMLGGITLYGIVNYKNIIVVFNNLDKIESIKDIPKVFAFIFGGNVFYGGLLGSLLAIFIVTKVKPDFKKFIDIIAVNIPLFHCFGRLGCFFGGCCYGITSSFGFTYKNNVHMQLFSDRMRESFFQNSEQITRFPVQLLESAFNLCLFFTLLVLYNKQKFTNKLLYVYLLSYATGRFFLEFLRGDAYRGIWLFLSTSQIISVLIIAFVTFLLFRMRKQERAGAL